LRPIISVVAAEPANAARFIVDADEIVTAFRNYRCRLVVNLNSDEWGWAVLVIGVVLVIRAAAMRDMAKD
jgi:hypothetical protein